MAAGIIRCEGAVMSAVVCDELDHGCKQLLKARAVSRRTQRQEREGKRHAMAMLVGMMIGSNNRATGRQGWEPWGCLPQQRCRTPP